MLDERLIFDLAEKINYRILVILVAGQKNVGKIPCRRRSLITFAGQWLQLRDVERLIPKPRAVPQPQSLGQAMRKETEEFFSHIVKEDRSVLEFLTVADYTLSTNCLPTITESKE